jgi:hypothetical protein
MTKIILGIIVSISLGGAVVVYTAPNAFGKDNGKHDHDWDHDRDHSSGGAAVAAPEFDPAEAMSGLTLLAGGLAVLRGRAKR